MPKGVKICLAVTIAVFIAASAAVFAILRPKKKNSVAYVEILHDNEVLYTFDLSEESDRTFRIESKEGWNDITIREGMIFVSDSDCPDKTCVKSGVLRYEHLPVVCLPHKLVIRFCEDDEQ